MGSASMAATVMNCGPLTALEQFCSSWIFFKHAQIIWVMCVSPHRTWCQECTWLWYYNKLKIRYIVRWMKLPCSKLQRFYWSCFALEPCFSCKFPTNSALYNVGPVFLLAELFRSSDYSSEGQKEGKRGRKVARKYLREENNLILLRQLAII